jgi:hypothetical protein
LHRLGIGETPTILGGNPMVVLLARRYSVWQLRTANATEA